MASLSAPIDIDCIIPAAGLSSRMGEWKLMLAYNDTTILEESVKNALLVCSRVILVAGHRADELIDTMSHYANVKIVVNHHYQQGLLSSIRLGIEHVCSDYFFVAHADMPCISEHIYQQLWQVRGAGSVFPGDEKRSGHPVLICSALRPLIKKATESQSMKAILKQFPKTYLKLSDEQIYLDIDTPEVYQKLRNS